MKYNLIFSQLARSQSYPQCLRAFSLVIANDRYDVAARIYVGSYINMHTYHTKVQWIVTCILNNCNLFWRVRRCSYETVTWIKRRQINFGDLHNTFSHLFVQEHKEHICGVHKCNHTIPYHTNTNHTNHTNNNITIRITHSCWMVLMCDIVSGHSL